MKFLEKATLVIFSIIILSLSIVLCLLIFGWVNISTINALLFNVINNATGSNILLAISVIFILLAIKCIFFTSTSKDNSGIKEGILLQNDNGKLLISKETLENLVSGIAKGFDGTENVVTKVELDKENNLKVQVTLFVHQNTVIKDLSASIQNRIKEAIKNTSDLDVKEVNIRIRNIAPENTTTNTIE